MMQGEDFSKKGRTNIVLSQFPATLSLEISSYPAQDHTMDNSKALFDYWHDRVRLKNYELIAASRHVQTQALRHECTNYDELWRSPGVQRLDEPERSKIIAIIKYECTAKVLQHRAGCLRDLAHKFEEACYEKEQHKSKLQGLIRALQEKLFGKDKEIKRLEARIASLDAENEALRTEAENDKAEAELRTELEKLRKQYYLVEKHSQKLAKKNMSLGGRVSHTERFRRQRDEARTLVEQQKNQITSLIQENQYLRSENEYLHEELRRLQK